MLRLTELKLPLDHPETALRAAIVQRLGVVDDDIVGFTVHKRSYDARKRRAVSLIYTVDVELRDGLEKTIEHARTWAGVEKRAPAEQSVAAAAEPS